MLRQTITYTDFNDDTAQETLYFNLSKSELMDNLHFKDRFNDLARRLDGPDREMNDKEVRDILALVKDLMKLSYGERSADGKRFAKSEEKWEEFTQTAAYDAFLYGLFVEPDKAIAFIMGIMPQDLRKEAEKAIRPLKVVQGEVEEPEISEPLADGPVVETAAPPVEDDRPAWKKEGRAPSQSELLAMSKEELVEAMKWRTQQG